MDQGNQGEGQLPPPLVIDLDGTLIYTDTLHEGALRMLRDRPLQTLRIPVWLAEGKAALKQRLASGSLFDPATLPYNDELLDWMRGQRATGRMIVLCTAADRSLAQAVADHLGLFDEVMASDGALNLSGSNKAEALEQRFGRRGFDYAGNSSVDFAVWERARRAIVVNASTAVAAKASGQYQVERTFPPKPRGVTAWRRVFRVHQWLKNLLLFVPLLAAHEWANADMVASLIVAFLAFSLCASSVYVANDLLDLESDRLHPRKRFRPFASGAVPVWMGVLLAPMLMLVSFAGGALVGGQFLKWLAVYFVLTCAYSWGLKRVMLVDCLTLALLYTLRIIAGAAAVGLGLTFWLLAFSVFLFLSLAFVKRYAELEAHRKSGKQKLHGRGYHTDDASLIQTMGITSGYASVLVLALYLTSDTVLMLYRVPEMIWGAVPVMLFWVSWMWMQAHRGRMHDDPLVFAVKDPASLAAGVVFALVMGLGIIGIPW
ncbi:4-hydroxybenzoate polyprenyl transferase [Bordetella ansorpii]|uniref:4-hydroxybenzoate polyprenyl transferase n=1 Tax=Bordetella ansorpii TaxID=288768 RepID=A0A157S9J7_9BORD|nr:UbiA family prenyltransferase [Bordetella ansorpii]SAI67110.1 4-hydroxybenzoate polyprenyl transferase [Bordetella ansorpii]